MKGHSSVEKATPASKAAVAAHQAGPDALVLSLKGNWLARERLPGREAIEHELGGGVRAIEFNTDELGAWDTGLLVFLEKLTTLARERRIDIRLETLPEGVRQLIRLSEAVAEPVETPIQRPPHWLARVGEWGLRYARGGRALLTFLGEIALGFRRLLTGKAQFRWRDAFLVMQQAGPEALGIVALINFLVGLILAFVGAVQLEQFGASIYVADLVAIAMVREMGALMTGIIMCGRTGAAFAAQLGTMKVNEELDALKTFGIGPVDFLVLPRILALVLMMPLLCVFADAIGIFGGGLVALSLLDVTTAEYVIRTVEAIELKTFLLGIVKGSVFGLIVALSGCLRGLQCGANAAAVGQATTAAVVAGITCIIAADGLFAVICHLLNI